MTSLARAAADVPTERESTSAFGAILFGHFISAIGAIGVPPFLYVIVSQMRDRPSSWLAGCLYVMPTCFGGVMAPLWGRLADRWGRKMLLIRAHSGLALGFLAAGVCATPMELAVALALQGALGGAFAASRACLCMALSPQRRVHALNWMEASPRLAYLVGPALVGLIAGTAASPRFPAGIYFYLAPLPLLGAALVAALVPTDPPRAAKPIAKAPAAKKPAAKKRERACKLMSADERTLCLLQFTLGFAAVLISPFFVMIAQSKVPGLSKATAGIVFGLPHGVFLVAAPLLTRHLQRFSWSRLVAGGFAVLGIAFAGQVLAASLFQLTAWRMAGGCALAVCLIALNGLTAQRLSRERIGTLLGWIESSSKLSSVLGGVTASALAAAAGPESTFFLASGVLIAAAAGFTFVQGSEA